MNVEDFQKLTGEEHEVADLLATYRDIELYYRQVLAAMYVPEQTVDPVRNSAEVTLSLSHEASATAFDLK